MSHQPAFETAGKVALALDGSHSGLVLLGPRANGDEMPSRKHRTSHGDEALNNINEWIRTGLCSPKLLSYTHGAAQSSRLREPECGPTPFSLS